MCVRFLFTDAALSWGTGRSWALARVRRASLVFIPPHYLHMLTLYLTGCSLPPSLQSSLGDAWTWVSSALCVGGGRQELGSILSAWAQVVVCNRRSDGPVIPPSAL